MVKARKKNVQFVNLKHSIEVVYIFIMKVYISCPKILNVTNVNIILLLRNIFRGMNKEHI